MKVIAVFVVLMALCFVASVTGENDTYIVAKLPNDLVEEKGNSTTEKQAGDSTTEKPNGDYNLAWFLRMQRHKRSAYDEVPEEKGNSTTEKQAGDSTTEKPNG